MLGNLFDCFIGITGGGTFNLLPLSCSLSEGICRIQKENNCEKDSTTCSDDNGRLTCPCKTGFKTVANAYYCEGMIIRENIGSEQKQAMIYADE